MIKQGEILHDACKRANVTASALAKRLGMTREYVYALFKKEFISSEIIASVTAFLPIQPADFFEPFVASDYTVIIFQGHVKLEGIKGEPWDKVMQVFHFPAGR